MCATKICICRPLDRGKYLRRDLNPYLSLMRAACCHCTTETYVCRLLNRESTSEGTRTLSLTLPKRARCHLRYEDMCLQTIEPGKVPPKGLEPLASRPPRRARCHLRYEDMWLGNKDSNLDTPGQSRMR